MTQSKNRNRQKFRNRYIPTISTSNVNDDRHATLDGKKFSYLRDVLSSGGKAQEAINARMEKSGWKKF